ncbi:hypothetical protein ACQ4PT_059727 [Festuca glaucescens]
MSDDPHQRQWHKEPPHYDDPDRFTVELDHNGFFGGLKEHLQYVSGSVDYFDNFSTDTFSIMWLEDFVKQGGNEMTDKTKFYWCVPGSDMRDGLCLIQNGADIEEEKEKEKEIDEEPASSACLSSAQLDSEDDEEGDTNSDYDAEDGDDDLFLDNIDKDVIDNNECIEVVEVEDDAGLDHDDLKLSNEQHNQLEYKFKQFNPKVDMETPVFKVGMLFSSMAEFRKALTTYGINERVKIRKSRNEATSVI